MAAPHLLSSVEDFDAWLADGWNDRRGYAEVQCSSSDYPLLTFSHSNGRAVLHWFAAPGTVLLLVGDATVDDATVLDFPVQDGDAAFTGRFISGLDRARRVAADALRAGASQAVGTWEPL